MSPIQRKQLTTNKTTTRMLQGVAETSINKYNINIDIMLTNDKMKSHSTK